MTAKDLKNALLQEAVQGKLVPQIASEGNARDLLEEIRKERGESLPLAPARKRASATPSAGSNAARNARFAPITEDEIPFEIPENWCWCRLGDCVNVQSSKRVFEKDYVNSGIPFYRSKEIGELSKGNQINTELFITNEHYKKLKETVGLPQKGDILLCSIGGSIGNTWINDGRDFYYKDGNVTQICNNKFIDTIFINYYLHSDLFTKQVKSEVAGSAYNALTIIKIKNLLFPLPPLAEQKRIVAAIEKFMPLIEEYGKKETELKTLNEQIGTLTKKAILQEAVQGKLVPQIASEGNAKDLLEEIKRSRHSELVSESKSKAKKEKPLPEITEDEIPFEIPESWCWCRLGEICTKLVDGDHNPPAGLQEKTEYLMLSSRNINDDKLVDLNLVRYLSKKVFEKENERTKAEKGDIFFTSVGTLGRSCIFDGSINVSFQRSVSIIKTEIFNYYLKYCLDSGYVQNFVVKNATGTAQKGFYLNQLAELIIPLPPLAEQKRIVAAIEKILPLCEKLGK